MSKSYIPAKDSLLQSWAANFSTLITAAPATYGLVAGDAVSIAAVVADFTDTYTTCIAPETRTKPNVVAKDNARAAMLVVVRAYAILIRNNKGVSDEDKLALGLTVPDLTPTPIPAPETSPILSIVGSTPGQLTVRYADSATPDKKAKPFGAVGIELWTDAPATGSPSLENADYQGTFTKQPLSLDTSGMTSGRTVTLWGRWITRAAPPGGQKALTGPWSSPVSFVIP